MKEYEGNHAGVPCVYINVSFMYTVHWNPTESPVAPPWSLKAIRALSTDMVPAATSASGPIPEGQQDGDQRDID